MTGHGLLTLFWLVRTTFEDCNVQFFEHPSPKNLLDRLIIFSIKSKSQKRKKKCLLFYAKEHIHNCSFNDGLVGVAFNVIEFYILKNI